MDPFITIQNLTKTIESAEKESAQLQGQLTQIESTLLTLCSITSIDQAQTALEEMRRQAVVMQTELSTLLEKADALLQSGEK